MRSTLRIIGTEDSQRSGCSVLMAAGTKALGSAPEVSRTKNNRHRAIAGVTIAGMDNDRD